MEAPPHAEARLWRSLILGRWRTSSRVVFALAFLILAFCNLPGQRVKFLRYEIGHPFFLASHLEHGWPFTFLTRQSDVYSPTYPNAPQEDYFALWQDCDEFRTLPLILNSVLALLCSTLIGLTFEVWRRQRERLWHIHLRDCFFAALAFSIAAAWHVSAQSRRQAENALLFPKGDDSGLSLQAYQDGGISWARGLVGEQAMQHLDRPFAVGVHERVGWSKLAALDSVRFVDSHVRGATQDLARLAELPRLEALALDEIDDDGAITTSADLPPLPKLRGLYLSQHARHCRRLDRLNGLHSLRITEGCIDDQFLREISVLPNLRDLALNGLTRSAHLDFLPRLGKLRSLDLYNGEISAAALKSIGQCQDLNDVSLYMCRVDREGIRHLSQLTKLTELDLQYTNVTDEDLKSLGSLRNLRILSLTDTSVGGDIRFMASLNNLETLNLYDAQVEGAALASLVGLPKLQRLDLGYTAVGSKGRSTLQQMKQLKWLRLSNCSDDELKDLQDALPNTQILLH